MNLQDFLTKWHQPPSSTLHDLSVTVLPNSCPFNPSQPIADTTLRGQCHLRADYAWSVIEESAKSVRIGTRSIESVHAEILGELDRALEGHLDQQRLRQWRRPAGKPVLVIITGAGFSAGFGLPVTKDLKDLIVEPCHDPEFSLFDQLPHMYEEAIAEYPLREFVRVGGDIPNFEQLLTLWPGVREQIRAYDDRWANTHEQFYRGAIERLCCHLYAKSWAVSNGMHRQRFEHTAAWLAKAVETYDIRFLNFNYDVVAEELIQAAGLDFEYVGERREASRGVIPVRKVHGSINWQRFDGECASANARMDLLYKSNAYCVYSFPEIDRCPYGVSGRIPVIVPPSADKQYEELLQTTWSFAANDIQSADKIGIIGYSFPKVDAFARHSLGKLLQAKAKGDGVMAVCRNADTADLVHLLQLPSANILNCAWEIEHLDRIAPGTR